MTQKIIEGLRMSWEYTAQDLPIASYSRDEVWELAADRLYQHVDEDVKKAFFALSEDEKETIKRQAFPYEYYE